MSYVFEKTSLSSNLIINSINSGGIPRPLEFVIAGIGLIFISPLLVVCSLLVRIGSKGPILFRQERVGINGENFTLFKFRTMLCRTSGLAVTSADDNRITKIGRFLRKHKLDELPELYNVLKGDMAFVGARPEVPEMVDMSDFRWVKVLQNRPGITDPVTIKLRNEESFLAQVEDKMTFYREVLQPFKLNGYLEYSSERSWFTDFGIIFQTLVLIVMPSMTPETTVEELALTSIGATPHDKTCHSIVD